MSYLASCCRSRKVYLPRWLLAATPFLVSDQRMLSPSEQGDAGRALYLSLSTVDISRADAD